MKRSWILSWLMLLVLTWPCGLAQAQTSASGPVYIVQAGDTLWSISQRFGVPMDELARANNLADANQLKAGDSLVIPGLEGIEGVLETRPILYGDGLRSLSRRYQVGMDVLTRLNHLASSQELYVGGNLILPQAEQAEALGGRAWLDPGQSLFEVSVAKGINPWLALLANQLNGSWQALPGDVLSLPGEAGDAPVALPPEIGQLDLGGPLLQGGMAVMHLKGAAGLALSGSFIGHELHFFNETPEQYVMLQGIHALTEPGIYPLNLMLTRADGAVFAFSQPVMVGEAGYPYDPVLYVDPATIDPQVTRPEDSQWTALTQPFSAEKLWDGQFSVPVAPEFKDCWPSRYGNRRSYNDGGYNFFHTGLDFCGQVGQDVFAPADGVVVFAGLLTVRGNATIIDHGWGVYTAYMHQSEILVQTGERVTTGQRIGLVGNTGRVTGPHLHWEIWVGGVQVDPLYWLEQTYP